MKKLSIVLITVIFAVGMAMWGCDGSGSDTGGCGGSSSSSSSGGGGECTDLVQYENNAVPENDTPYTGPYEVVIEWDPDFPNHTIIRPVGADNMPILSWGEGGCVKNGRAYVEMMSEVASHGIVVIADGKAEGSGDSPGSMMNPVGTALIQGIDYIIEKNSDPCSPLYQKVDTTKIAVSGQSCGGLLALRAAADPRVTVTFIMSSGLFQDNPEVLEALHTPIIYLNGGSTDVAYSNAQTDIANLDAMNTLPVYWANLGIGHMGDILEDNGGQFGWVLASWLQYQFFGDPTSKALFVGENCGLCQDNDHDSLLWSLDKYNGAP